MSEIYFGTIWTLFTAFITFIWIKGSKETFLILNFLDFRYKFFILGVPIFIMSVFWAIGLIILRNGIKNIIINSNIYENKLLSAEKLTKSKNKTNSTITHDSAKDDKKYNYNEYDEYNEYEEYDEGPIKFK